MSDADLALARFARAALASARQATLLIAEIGAVDCEVVLYEHDGRPQFLCLSDSPVAGATGRVAELHVPLDCARGGGIVELAGRLVLVNNEDDVTIVELGVDSVIVQRGNHGRRSEIPVETYLSAAITALDEYAARLVTHTNDTHQHELRAFAARLCDVDVSAVAAATLAELDATGVELQWIDSDGYHLLRLGFDHVATEPQELAVSLRTQLHARRRGSV